MNDYKELRHTALCDGLDGDLDELIAERNEAIKERDELRAARIAYASEFALDAEGYPDTGSIHQNIRALKAERDALLRKAFAFDAMVAAGRISQELADQALALYPGAQEGAE